MQTKSAKQVRKYLSEKYGVAYKECVVIKIDSMSSCSAERDNVEKLMNLDRKVEDDRRLWSGRMYERPDAKEISKIKSKSDDSRPIFQVRAKIRQWSD